MLRYFVCEILSCIYGCYLIIKLTSMCDTSICTYKTYLKYYCYSKMYKFVGPSEVISSKQKKTEIKLDINLLSQTNKYKTKQTNQKYQTERKKPTWMHLLSIWLSSVHIIFIRDTGN